MPLPVGARLGVYEILAPLGAGGMGEVYRAKDTKLGRQVALKVLPGNFLEDEERKKRFEREARLLATLNHPGIAAIYSFEEIPGSRGPSGPPSRHLLVQELLEGETLRERLRAGALPARKAIDVAAQIAQALAAAHEKGIVHRDLKPENVFLTKDGRVKILDFGLAKLSRRDEAVEKPADAETLTLLTEEGTVFGTVSYMSPEQVRGEPVDHRSDIFSLGTILYEMLSGENPFRTATTAESISAILREEPPPLPESVSPGLARIVGRCLEKRADERFQSASDLSFALTEPLGSGMSRAVPATSVVSRRTVLILAAAAVGLLGIALILRPWRRAGGTGRIESLAVLPLANLSGDPQQEYFADGMTEELITDLAQIGALRVTSRTSAMRYKGTRKSVPEIATELHVDAVVEGSVLRVGDRVRITAQLIQAPADKHLWASNYERDLRDVLALQGEVARAIAGEIGVRLTPQEQSRLANKKTVNPGAYEAYLKGRYHLFRGTAPDAQKSLDYFQQSVAKQPDYAAAYAGVANAYEQMAGSAYGVLSPKEAFPKAKAAAMRAVELDSTLAESNESLGWISFVFERDWAAAEERFQRALRLNPNYPDAHQSYATFLSRMGRFDEAIPEVKRAQELDPLSLIGNLDVGLALHGARREDEAILWFRRVLDMDPNFLRAHFGLGRALVQNRNYVEAISELQRAVELSEGGAAQLGSLGYALAVAGRRAEALGIVEKLKKKSRVRYVPPSALAIIFSGLGEKDQAFEWLEKANEERDPWVTGLKVEPMFDPLRSDPRFQDLMRRVGLPP